MFTLILQPNPGFIGPITVACLSGIPSTIATASPTMINVTTTPSPPITITCTLRTNCVAQLVGPRVPGGWPQSPAPVPPFTAASGVALLLALWWRKAAYRSLGTSRPSAGQAWGLRLIPLWATFVLLLLVMTWTACGVSNPPPAIPNAPTTPAGVYQIQVVATAPGGVRQVVSLNVHVI